MSLRDELLHLFSKHPRDLFKTNEISKMIGIKSDDPRYQDLRDTLSGLELEGKIERGSRRRYALSRPQLAEIEGSLSINSAGNGIVSPDPEFDLGDTVLIRKDGLLTALDGDRVRVALFAADTNERPQGEVIAVLRQAEHRIIGVVQRGKHGLYVRPEGAKMRRDIFIARKDLHGAGEGDKVAVELFEWNDEYQQPEGEITEILNAETETQYSRDVIAAEYGLPEEFPKDVTKELKRFSVEIQDSELAKRLDLRDRTIFTIDPEDAKDFDDAISLEENEDGTLLLGVHIADVSHYATEGSALDREALARGTSVYLVGGVIPMLPERLSNELCSLRPEEDKLTYSVLMTVDPESGEVLRSEFQKTVIRSVMRFSYEEAEERTVSGRGKYAKLLRAMRKLSLKMYARRREAGSIDFESDEYRFRFNDKGEPIEAYKKDRLGSMRMIEDFMLAANRAVAEHIAHRAKKDNELPFLYRIHADPDPAKLRDLAQLAKTLGYKTSLENARPKAIQAFLESVKGRPEEHLLNQLMLRAMAKAVYAEHNVGHFGLAFLHYTHFTSPIRRYPDLIVHRMLFEYQRPGGMNREREHHYYEILPEIADQTSALERRATEAERESVKLAQIHILKDKVGEEFDAVITGVVNFGMFVQIAAGAEGLVHVRELPGHYVFDEAHYALVQSTGRLHYETSAGAAERKRFRIGDPVRVQLIKVLEEKRQLDFRLAESADQPLPEDRPRQHRSSRPETGESHRRGRRASGEQRGDRHSGGPSCSDKPDPSRSDKTRSSSSRKKSYHKRKSTRR
jgi:ribonuclease R